MELKAYAQIIWRYLWVVILVPVVALVGSLWLRPAAPTHYTANVRLAVGVTPEAATAENRYYTYDRYYTWLTAEYLADDLVEVVRSRAFADDVRAHLQARYPNLEIGSIQGATNPQKTHRILSVSVTAGTADEAMAIAGAIADVLKTNGSKYLAQLSATNAAIAVIDPPTVLPPAIGLRERLDLPLRLVLALAVGIALAFLLDYLDDSVRGPADLEALGLEVVGEVETHR